MVHTPLLHVLGGSAWRVATVRKAKALGYRVLVTDMFEARPAYALADHHEVVDITDLERTLEVARRHHVDGILCDTTDVGVPTAGFVAEQLGLPGIGFEVARNCTDKGRMRRLTAGAGLASGAYRVIECVDDFAAASRAVGLPLLVKPVDNQSSRGVTLVRRWVEIEGAWQLARQHSRCGQVLIEACIEGQEFIVDGFAVAGVWSLLGIALKSPSPGQATTASRIRYLDGDEFDTMRVMLEPALVRTAQALGLQDGLVHAEFIVGGGRAVPIDVAARGGGVMIYERVLPYVSGIDAMGAAIRSAIGQTAVLHPLETRRGAVVEYIDIPVGQLLAVEGVAQAAAVPGVAALHFNVQPGQWIGAALNKDERSGFVIALAASSAEAVRIAERAKAQLRVRIAGTDGLLPVT